jgi:hypothetical protein
MKNHIVLAFLLLPLLSGCNKACAIVGDIAGIFEGDLSGDLSVSVVESKADGMADLTINLSTDTLSPFGSAEITCEGGAFNVTLQTADVPDFGTLSGDLSDGLGSGEWSFTSGETGTWSAGE